MSQKLCHFCDTYTTCKYRFGLGDASGLARNIEVNGHITPLIVVADGEACQLVAEHRRTAAMKSLGLEEADAYVVDRDSLGDGCHGCGGDCGRPGLVAVVRPQAWGEGADVTFYCTDNKHVMSGSPPDGYGRLEGSCRSDPFYCCRPGRADLTSTCPAAAPARREAAHGLIGARAHRRGERRPYCSAPVSALPAQPRGRRTIRATRPEVEMHDSRMPVTAGVDTHKDAHALCVLDGWGRKAFEGVFPATEEGYSGIAEAIGDPARCAVVGVECTMTYGAGLARHLSRMGFSVVEVLHPERKRGRGRLGKHDLGDAERAARAAAAGRHTSVPKAADGWVESVRCLMVSRRLAVKTTTAAANAAKGLLTSSPDRVRAMFADMGTEAMMESLAGMRDDVAACSEPLRASLRGLASMWAESRGQAQDAETRILRLVEENAPALLAINGCGAITAAELAVAAGDNPERMRNKDSFAALCGASPIEASSGKVRRHRLNRGGNRRANCALHRIVLSRTKNDERTKAYMERRRSEGKSKREAIRCLKRYVANEVYRALMDPKDVPKSMGSELRGLRRELGMTQAQAAQVLSVSRSKISEVELGKKRSPLLEKHYLQALERLAASRAEIMPLALE